MKENSIFIGIDVSKLKLDIYLLSKKGYKSFQVKNTTSGYYPFI
ncbi:hypothetical protein [Lutibacter sp.]|nr:hypothetical protein [Lutibacter sp.]